MPATPASDLTLDRFQLDAIAAIDDGHSVVVAAPTGAGKTVVAEHAIRAALAADRKVFYTTPIKALSNQKYRDLAAEHGPHRVGLLTGDNAINAQAPIVVMTTEVLRNMLYATSPLLHDLRWVVLDEVHYLEDPYRGPVWEEVVIHLPPDVGLVALSATVSNVDELAGWMRTVRGDVQLVVEHRRPVPLQHEYVVAERHGSQLHIHPLSAKGRSGRDGARFDVEAGRGRGRPRRRWVTPRREEVVTELHRRDLLPAIYFIFSRAACEDAMRALAASKVAMTTDAEQRRIADIVHDHVGRLSAVDRETLGVDRWARTLSQGIAAHHAGMVPPMKEAVEACFVEGLIKVVFATETLALGINMPARSVVIERLTKFTGDDHRMLTPGQYTQLAGRAGRRGIDDRGHVWVLWSPWLGFEQVADLVRSREFELRSAFRPNYNMAANLVNRHDRDDAIELLRSSFGQYQQSRRVADMAAEARDLRREAEHLEHDLRERLGDDRDWRSLLGEGAADRSAIEAALQRLRPGDASRFGAAVGVVLTSAQRQGITEVSYCEPSGRVRRARSTTLDELPVPLGHLDLPVPYAPNDPDFRAEAAASLRLLVRADAPASGRSTTTPRALLRRARKLQRLLDDAEHLERRADEGGASLVRKFDDVLAVLGAWGYVRGWSLTDAGQILRRIYHESDLLVAEALRRGAFDDLVAADLAGVVSALVYERRGPGEGDDPWYPTRRLRDRVEALDRCWDDLVVLEERHGLPLTRPPDGSVVAMVQAWAAGGGLDEVIEDEDLSGGDFVRIARLVIDLLGQIARAAPQAGTRAAASRAGEALRRGIVDSPIDPEPEAAHELDGARANEGRPS